MSGRAARDTWINPILALALCALAGASFAWLRTPLPWMIGPLLAMAGANFAGARLRSIPGSRQLGQMIIGTALGLYFTPAVSREVASYWLLLVIAALFAIFLAWGCAWFLSRTTDTDRTTAFFASVPGGAAEMAVLGERYGARVDRIALAQSLRILVVVIVVPFALTYSGVHGTDAYRPAMVAVAWQPLALMLCLAMAAGAALSAARIPNAFMFGPLMLSVGLTASDVQFSSVPTWLSSIGQLLLGCALGSRFEQQFLSGVTRYVGAVFASILLAMAMAAVFGVGLAQLAGLPVASLILATAPGGIAEMCITAKVLELGVPLVTAAHVTRVVVLMTTTAPIYRWVRGFRGGATS
jgi:membrane AbrB-like protein